MINRAQFFLRMVFFVPVAFFSFPSLSHASITPSLSPSRTTGVAPLSVFFDASSTTSTATSLPFHEIDYAWNFGDDDTLTWDYGARPGVNKKNRAYGPEAAHVFEPTSFPDDCSGTPCKTYTVTLTIFDGTDTETTTQVITVTDPDAVYADADTICIAADTTPVAGAGGCPGGADVHQQSNFSTAIDTYIATGKRLLFKRGDTFTTATTASLDQDGPWTVGAYGSGEKPIVRSTLATDASLDIYGGILVIGSGSGGVFMNDGRIMDIAINANDGVGNIVGKGTTAIRGGTGTFDEVTLLRVDISDLNNAFSFSSSHLSTTLDTMWDKNTIQDSTAYNLINSGGNGMYVMGKRMAILGNSIDNNGGGEHNFRSMYWNKLVLSNNTFKNPNTTKANISLRSMYDAAATSFLPANSWSEFAVVSGNEMTGTGATISVATFNDQGFDRRSRNVIFENNWWHDQSGSNFALSIASSDLTTARNNVIHVGGAMCITSSTDNNPNYIFGTHWVYNNTCYTTSLGDAWGEKIAMRVYAHVGAVNFSNNLVYMPNVTNTVYMPMLDVSAGPITSSNNSTSLQARTTNPFPVSTPSILADFIPTTGSYALASGTSVPVYRDFYNNLRGGTMDMGAFKEDSDPNDITPPTITSVTSDKANGTYITGEVIDIDVTFSEAVTSTGNVTITLETGTTDRTCTFTVSNSTTGTCNYTVQTGDTTSDLTTSSISGTITDQSNNAMVNFTPATTLGTNKALIIDATPPTLSESSPISTSTDTTPDYTFTTTEAGTITYGGDCTSSTTTASSGSNTITLNTLSVGTHANCTITVTDSLSNASTPLAITSFTITEEAATPSSEASSDSSEKKPKKKKISGNIIYKKGERIPPYITLQSPRIDAKTTASFRIQATAKDRSGIQAMFVSINGLKKKRMNTNSILYTAKKRKNSSITVTAYDTLGNVKVAQITVTDGKVGRVRYY